jgi:hypothetical protein
MMTEAPAMDDDAAHTPMGAVGGSASPASSPPNSPELRAAARNEQKQVEEEEPEHLICPISRCMFRDPVFVPGSGNT